MANSYKGRTIIKGELTGKAVVSTQKVNIVKSYDEKALEKGDNAICVDKNNSDLYKKELSGKILCLPKTTELPNEGLILQSAAKSGIAPIAMLFAERIDSKAAAGIILSDIWDNSKIVAIDSLGEDFLNAAKDNMTIQIKQDGEVLLS